MAHEGDEAHGDRDISVDSETADGTGIRVVSVVQTRAHSIRAPKAGEFVSLPLTKTRHIPTPTIRDVAYAIAQYLDAHLPGTLAVANVFTHPHRPNAKESRYEAETEIVLVLSDTSDNDRISRVYIGIVGKACQSTASRLWPERTIAWIYSKEHGFNYAIELNPHPDRSISIRTARAHMPDCISDTIGYHLPSDVQATKMEAYKSFIGNYVRNGSADIVADAGQFLAKFNVGKEVRELVPYDPATD